MMDSYYFYPRYSEVAPALRDYRAACLNVAKGTEAPPWGYPALGVGCGFPHGNSHRKMVISPTKMGSSWDLELIIGTMVYKWLN